MTLVIADFPCKDDDDISVSVKSDWYWKSDCYWIRQGDDVIAFGISEREDLIDALIELRKYAPDILQ